MARVAALVLLVLGLLPVANWIPGGHAATWYGERLDGWLSGGAIVAGLAVIGAMAAGRWPGLWRDGLWARPASRWRRGGVAADACLAVLALVLYAVVARVVLSGKPLLIDEVVQLFQARTFATGALWRPADAHPEFTGVMHLLDWSGRVYGQFPAGGPAMLALGTLLGLEWLVGPCFAALAVFAFARLARRLEPHDGAACAAVLLFAFAPFTAFLGGSMMNHVTAMAWIVVAAWGTAVATADRPRPGVAFLTGIALGLAAAIRPLDGAVFALPTGAWLLWRARRGGGDLAALLASGVGVALPLAALLAVNAGQTGDPFRFGYIEMWGRTHELGFHETPWGFPHTPVTGLELVNLYLLRLQTYLFEVPGPSLLFASFALLLARTLRPMDRWVLVGSGGILLAYFAYWHDGFYLGPRFMLPLAPWLALWTARLPAVLADREAPLPLRRGVVLAGAIALLMGATLLVPLRARQYRLGLHSMRFDIAADARRAGVRDALVLVRESWGSQVMARLWGAGVSRRDAEALYRSTDMCRLDEAVAAAERSGGGAAAVHAAMAPFRADSGRLVSLTVSPDSTPLVTRGSTLTPRCVRRVMEDRGGFTVFAPFLLAEDDGNRYRRDLGARDSLLLLADPARPIWLVMQDATVGGPLRFYPVSRDSALAVWRAEAAERP